jgi:hypothetical protein
VTATTGTQDRIEQYVNLVCSEIRATAALSEHPLETISFGGGVRLDAMLAQTAASTKPPGHQPPSESAAEACTLARNK